MAVYNVQHFLLEFAPFSIFGVAPLLGRTFGPEDKANGEHRVAVLSYKLWRNTFVGDRRVVGRAIRLGGMTYTVVGVMPQSFKMFALHTFGLPTGEVEPQLWVPYGGSMSETGAHFFACPSHASFTLRMRQT